MKVILLQDIANIGKKGETKEVSNGFVMNFLFPQKLAILATEQNIQKQKSVVKQKEKKKTLQQENYQRIAKTLNKQTLKFSGKTSSQDHLFQAIHEADIIASIKQNFKLAVEQKWFKDFVALKDLGKHQIYLQLPDTKQILINIKIEAL